MSAVVAFLLSPVGRYLGLFVAVVGLLFAVWNAGYHSAASRCDAAALRSELATVRADLAIAQGAAAEGHRLARANEAAAKQNMERVHELEANPPDPACPTADPLDYDRLRRIR
jgi:hypothetical protein